MDQETTGAAYDRFGKAYRRWWSPVVAPWAVGLLDRLTGVVPQDRPISLLDVGVGTGTLAIAALERWPLARAIGVDPSQVMLDMAREEAVRRGRRFGDRLRVIRGSAEHLPLPDATVDLALSSFVIQLVSSRAPALREMHRVVHPGGTVAVLTWQIYGESFLPDDVVRHTFDELGVPGGPGGGDPLPYTSPQVAAAELRRIGFREVRARRVWLEHRFTARSYADLVEHWTEDDALAGLSAPRRALVRRRLRNQLARLPADAFVWRRPLVSLVARRPELSLPPPAAAGPSAAPRRCGSR